MGHRRQRWGRCPLYIRVIVQRVRVRVCAKGGRGSYIWPGWLVLAYKGTRHRQVPRALHSAALVLYRPPAPHLVHEACCHRRVLSAPQLAGRDHRM